MQKTKMIVLLALMLCAGSAAWAQKVSVYVAGNITSAQKTVVEDRFIDELTKVKSVTMLERARAMCGLMQKEEDYQLSGEVAEKEILNLCQRKGAEYVVAVNVVNDDEVLCMTARMIRLEDGSILHSVKQEREITDRKTLVNLSNKTAYMLRSKIKGNKL